MPVPLITPRVLAVASYNSESPNVAGLDDRVVLQIDGLSGLVPQLVACKDLVLFLDGVPIAGDPPLSCDPPAGRVRFDLHRAGVADSAWQALLGEPETFHRRITVSLGPSVDKSFATGVKDFELEVVPEVPFSAFAILFVATLIYFVRLARTTSLLRDPHVMVPVGAKAPYSLARFQLAFWFFLVLAAYVFLWMINQELDTITSSVLTLLGIGSGTALGASLIDSNKATPIASPEVSQGFLRDVLRDSQGISFYRFQMFAWTLALGVIFIASVYEKLSMPQFSPTLLGLMGISSGTFLGAKLPER